MSSGQPPLRRWRPFFEAVFMVVALVVGFGAIPVTCVWVTPRGVWIWALPILLLMSAAATLLLFRYQRAIARRGTCPWCGYSWSGLRPQGRCPECGVDFETIEAVPKSENQSSV